jgi:sigma-E factor negative regulatory protein RseA
MKQVSPVASMVQGGGPSLEAEHVWISALVDGQYEPGESEWRDLGCDAGVKRSWAEYQLIGDAIRSPDLVTTSVHRTANVAAGVMQRLEQEPVVFAPGQKRAANSGALLLHVRRWGLPGASIAAAAAAVVWIALPQMGSPGPAVASSGTSGLVSTQTSNGRIEVKTDPALDALLIGSSNSYLRAHQQVSWGSARNGLTSNIQSVSVQSSTPVGSSPSAAKPTEDSVRR